MFKPQGIASTAWAFTMLGHLNEILCAAFARTAQLCISESEPQNIANTAWAFATRSLLEEKSVAVLARAAQLHISERSTAWAFKTLGQFAIQQSQCAGNRQHGLGFHDAEPVR